MRAILSAMDGLTTPRRPIAGAVLAIFVTLTLHLSACATGGGAPSGAAGDATIVPLPLLAQTIAEFRGQTLRSCGPIFQRVPDGRAEWTLATQVPGSRHPAGVRVLPCGRSAPRVDASGCITGTIARSDGSTTLEGAPGTVSSAALSSVWFLHEQCRD